MNVRHWMLLAVSLILNTAPALAQELSVTEDLEKRLAEVELELLKLRGVSEKTPASEGPQSQGVPGNLRQIHDRPFLHELWNRIHIGGYAELEYHSYKNGLLGSPEGFRLHRTNLFLFSDISDTIRFGSESEFETEFDGGEVSSDIEVAIEMAFIDWTLSREFVFRGGVLLPPLGRVNVNHDGPVRDLTDRPLVSTFIIPTTLSDAGVGFHGELPRLGNLSFGYQAYFVNGFNILDDTGQLNVPITNLPRILRENSDAIGGDGNDRVAFTGRLDARSSESIELGLSWHIGEYDERADNTLTIVAADVAVNHGHFSFEGELANADFERDAFARTAGVPDHYWGYYAQASFQFEAEELRPYIPQLFNGEGSSLSFVTRYDYIDLDGDRGAAVETGIALRPGSDTVLKFSYRFAQLSIGQTIIGREDERDSGFVFSFSTYF